MSNLVKREDLPLSAALTEKGLQLGNFGELFQYAHFLKDAGFVPPGLKDANAVTIAIIAGKELGLGVMQSVQSIAVINNRPTLWGDALPALVHASNKASEIEEWFESGGKRTTHADLADAVPDDLVAVCRAKRKGDPTDKFGRFSVKQAKDAGLWSKQGPWKMYPLRMLQMRARGFCFRDAFADVLGGIGMAEEVQDYEVDEPTHLVPTGQKVPSAYWDRAKLNDQGGAQALLGGEGFEPMRVGDSWQIGRVVKGPAPRVIESTPVFHDPPKQEEKKPDPKPQPKPTAKPSRSDAQVKSGAEACAKAFKERFKIGADMLARVVERPQDQWTAQDVDKLREVFGQMMGDPTLAIAAFIPYNEPQGEPAANNDSGVPWPKD